MKPRSAAERSWIAHIGLIALVLLAFAPLVLPSWTIETPAMFSQAPAPAETRVPAPPAVSAPVREPAASSAATNAATPHIPR